jgi:hypothetical protein
MKEYGKIDMVCWDGGMGSMLFEGIETSRGNKARSF